VANRLLELTRLFLKLGVIGFGGPAAHIATMEEETVNRRGWLTHEEFLDLVGATNLIPGPNSTEMAMHVGYRRAGFLGLVVAGASFILPAVAITVAFAWIYVQLGQLPEEQVQPVLNGIKPAVIAIIFAALWRLAGKALKTFVLAALSSVVAIAALALPGYEVQVLLGSSIIGMVILSFRPPPDKEKPPEKSSGSEKPPKATAFIGPIAAGGGIPTAGAGSSALAGVSIWKLGLFFLKIGAVLYGSGYVLIAYLRGGLIEEFGWLTEAQLLDAIAVGQFTPGPILSTASFIGFVVMCPEPGGDVWRGLQGAALASFAIFLPSFFFVAALGPLVPRLRKNVWAGRFLDAVNAASIGLMAAVTLALCEEVFFRHDPPTGDVIGIRWFAVMIAGLAGSLLLRWKLSPAWLVAGGAVVGWGTGFLQ